MRKKTYYASQLKKATHMLFFKHHRKPGVKGWELKKKLGSDYPKIVALLDRHLEKLDLQVKTIFEEEPKPAKPSKAQLDRARFCITLRGSLAARETKMMGWRVDDIAGLALTISTIISRKGKAPREEVEQLLRDKLPEWKANINLERYIKAGYIDQDDKGQLYLDWRTTAEVDKEKLMDMLMAK